MENQRGGIKLITMIAIVLVLTIVLMVLIIFTNKDKEESSNSNVNNNNISNNQESINQNTANNTNNTNTTWYYDNNGNVTNGNITLEIGDYINYDATKDENGNLITEKYTSPKSKNGVEDLIFEIDYKGTWQVLGVENGSVIIMSTEGVGSELLTLKGKAGLQYGVEELNNISSIFGKGKGAIKARSVTANDINKVTGFDPKEYEQGTIAGYGNKITYKMNNEGYVEYSCEQTSETDVTGDTDFRFFNGKEIKVLNKGQQITLKNSGYDYEIEDFSNAINENTYNLLVPEKTLDVLNNNDTGYWLASQSIMGFDGVVGFCLKLVSTTGSLFDVALVESSEDEEEEDCMDIRPVVYLKSDIQLEKSEQNKWIIK